MNSSNFFNEKFLNKILEENSKNNFNNENILNKFIISNNNLNNLVLYNNDNLISSHKRKRDKEMFGYDYSPLKSSYLNPFSPSLTRESPNFQKYFNFNTQERIFTPTSAGGKNFIFNYTNKGIKTPQDMKNRENL